MKKRHIVLLAIIFMLSIRLFFSIFFGNYDVWAKTNEKYISSKPDLLAIEPLNRIDKGIIDDKCESSTLLCQSIDKNTGIKEINAEYEDLVEGYPIEEMLEAIGKLDKKTGDFLIAIAKKESDWGKHAPSKSGADCYNYWGYKGREEGQVLGYSCFSTPEEAVEKVGGRINKLIQKGLNTPEKMLVWKCGSSCAGHDPRGVEKWVSDVKSVLKSIKS